VEVKSVLRIGSAHNNVRTSNVNIVKIRIFRIRRILRTKMVLDIQIVHHILENTAIQNVNKPFVSLHYGLDFHFKGRRRMTFAQLFCILPDLSKTENFVDFTQNY
jgi:hypothetical protein